MFVKILQASTITLVLYALLGLNNTLQTNVARGETVEPSEVIVALKQALIRGQ
ncbi:MAG: hypothetical protein AAFQ63_13045 [Cyanobacteria bacterium J06621_11]